MLRSALVISVVLAAVGCAEIESVEDGHDNIEFDTQTSVEALTAGTPQAMGVLNLLNDRATTLDVLDNDARLNKRAARGIVHHRNGPDGVFGTRDDLPFTSVREIDAIRYVGPVALARLAYWAQIHGYVPMDDDYLGTWDGLDFTVREASEVLHLVNTLTAQRLDNHVGLDKRAVKSIVEARPVQSLAQLSELYFLGQAQVRRLKEYKGLATSAQDCIRGANACAENLTCYGTGRDDDAGRCVNLENVPAGAGDGCSETSPCGRGLVCAGLTLGWDEGICNPSWQEGTYRANHAFHVPDDPTLGFNSTVRVFGQATVPMDLIVTIDVDHPRPQDLALWLEDPNGQVAAVWAKGQGTNGVSEAFVGYGISRDDAVNGLWTLHAFDTTRGKAGIIRGWSLYVTSNFD
jgi:hypothetical protein